MHTITRITEKGQRQIAKDFINQYHSYIRYADRPSRKMYWLLHEDDRLVGVFGLGSAFTRNKIIQNYLNDHQILFNEIANNIVFCLYATQHKNSGTIFLSMIRRDAKVWWKE